MITYLKHKFDSVDAILEAAHMPDSDDERAMRRRKRAREWLLKLDVLAKIDTIVAPYTKPQLDEVCEIGARIDFAKAGRIVPQMLRAINRPRRPRVRRTNRPGIVEVN